MLQIKTITKSLLGLVIIGISLSSCRPKAIKMDDSEIVQNLSHAPLRLKIEMNKNQRINLVVIFKFLEMFLLQLSKMVILYLICLIQIAVLIPVGR